VPNPRITINEPGHAHELTFSCYRRRQLLDNDTARMTLIEHLDKARRKWKFDVWAYVIMPEHVHLLVFPKLQKYSMSAIRRDIKRPMAREYLQHLKSSEPAVYDTLRNEDGGHSFWQPGPGYDRNLFSDDAIRASLDYMHANPVKRGLCESDGDWIWSSARW
jgi:putative transposase